MTQDEAITLFMDTIGKTIGDTGPTGRMVSAHELATMLAKSNRHEHVSAFVAAFDGQCPCGKVECLTKLVDAVEKCMHRCNALYSPGNHAPTVRTLQ